MDETRSGRRTAFMRAVIGEDQSFGRLVLIFAIAISIVVGLILVSMLS